MTMADEGISYVMQYEKRCGREPVDVSRGRKFPGLDVMSIDNIDGHHGSIEVKATNGGGIPDAFETEFTRGLRFVATHLYVVNFKDRKPSSLHIVPKNVIDQYSTPRYRDLRCDRALTHGS